MIYPKIVKNRLNLIFIAHLLMFGLVVFGWWPRTIVPFWAGALLIYCLLVPLEETVLFFVRSIPFFVALPLTTNFDNFNMWRILALVIFLRWLTLEKIKNLLKPKTPVAFSLWLIIIAATFSLLVAASPALALRRIIYFLNLALIGIVIQWLARHREFAKRLIANITIPTMLVIALGFFQLWTTYVMNIFQFVDLWCGIIERNLYGNAWAEIALKANTWFAYFGDRLSLRMFSIFPDSHSFPMFVIFGLPAIMAYALEKVVALNISYRGLAKSRGRIWLVFVPLAFLAVILSGTRGMWVAGAVSLFWTACLIYWVASNRVDHFQQSVFRYLATYLVFFLMLFTVAYPIFGSAQFQVSKEDAGVFARRVRSAFDFGETSNARRIEIWKASLASIKKHPWLGVGIGNFPVVVGEDLARAKAGSSAHNLYLHIAAELGVPAFLVALYFLWLLLAKCYRNFLVEKDPLLLIYFGAMLIFLPWNLFYLFTDVAIFDERVFLLFVTTVALLLSQNGKTTHLN